METTQGAVAAAHGNGDPSRGTEKKRGKGTETEKGDNAIRRREGGGGGGKGPGSRRSGPGAKRGN